MDKKEPFAISVNAGQHNFAFLPDEARQLDIVPDGPNGFQILYNGRSWQAEVLDTDYTNRQFTVRVNGTKFNLHIADHYERLIQQLGLNVAGSQKQNVVKAPMPGLVLNIMVEAGQAVQKGDPLLILEAMKMENVIKAAADGVVKSIAVQKGAPVEKGQLLLNFDA
jgi:acetyl/propionyl-CoA carboxylase alpha subunit